MASRFHALACSRRNRSLALVAAASWLGYAVAFQRGLDHLRAAAQQRLAVEAARLDGYLSRSEYLPSLLETSPSVFQLLGALRRSCTAAKRQPVSEVDQSAGGSRQPLCPRRLRRHAGRSRFRPAGYAVWREPVLPPLCQRSSHAQSRGVLRCRHYQRPRRLLSLLCPEGGRGHEGDRHRQGQSGFVRARMARL